MDTTLACLLLAADAVELSPGTPTTIVGTVIFVTVTLVVALGWLNKHLITITIPKLLEVFLTESKAQRDACSHDSERLRTLFSDQIQQERVTATRDQLENRTLLKELTAIRAEEREMFRKLAETVTALTSRIDDLIGLREDQLTAIALEHERLRRTAGGQ